MGGTLFNPVKFATSLQKFTSFPCTKYIHFILTFSKALPYCRINSKSKISAKYDKLKKPKVSSSK